MSSKNDIKVKDVAGLNALPTQTWGVAASATLIYPGELVKLSTLPNIVKLADGDGVIGTTTQIVGLAKSTSTNTASTAGTVEVFVLTPNTILAAKPKVAGSCDTDAEIAALMGKRVVIDVTGTTPNDLFTLDTAAADSTTNAFQIVGGDSATDTVYFTVRSSGLQGIIV